MKNYHIFCLITCLIISISCGSHKDKGKDSDSFLFETQPEFRVNKITFQKWAGGTQASGAGYNMNIFTEQVPDDIKLDSIYFRGLNAKIKKSKTSYAATLLTVLPRDMVLSNEAIEEMSNTVDTIKTHFPFHLNDDECVISYIHNDRSHFVKMTNLTEKEMALYPASSPKN